MRKTTALVMALVGFFALHGAELPAITVYPRPAVAGLESELRLPHDLGGNFHGTLRIVAPDGRQEEHQVQLADGGAAFFRWTPQVTGYHQLELKGEEFPLAKTTVPVVWQRMHFYSWAVPAKLEQLASYSTLGSTCIIIKGSPERYEQCRRLGIVPLAFVGHKDRTDVSLTKPAEDVVRGLFAKWKSRLDGGADGIWVDEVGSYPDDEAMRRIAIIREVLKQLRAAYPKAILHLAVAGNVLREQATMAHETGTILASEAYPDCATGVFATHDFIPHINSRLDCLRAGDMLFDKGYSANPSPTRFKKCGGIILLGLNNCFGVMEEPAAPRIEYLVRHIRRYAPEAPGLAFWSSHGDKIYTEKYLPYSFLDGLLERYCIRPVLDLQMVAFSDYAPKANTSVEISLEVHNLGGMALYSPYHVKAFAIDNEGKRFELGEATRERIGVGFAAPDLPTNPRTVQRLEVDGNVYQISNFIKGKTLKMLLLSRQTLVFKFTPPHSGYYKIAFELEAPEDATVMNGTAEATLRVR
ncbi:MAG: hypothetical protein IJS08_18675 [Victivallales bacterium]|nr:hypothetical protein [Victivallales bacterium]